MQENGEETMANEGAILSLVVLLGVKGQTLLPVCVQALYNLTCAENHFKGLERIIKAMLNITSMGYDPSEYIVKALVNCARFSWLRLRIIEDGAISFLNSLLSVLPTMDYPLDLCFYMLIAFRSLSDSSGCRSDMLSKGSIEVLSSLLPYCDDRCELMILKVLHNFLQSPVGISLSSFEVALLLVLKIVEKADQLVIQQYGAACIHIFTREKVRGLKHLATLIVDIMPRLLQLSDPLTQFFVISSCGNLFFGSLW